VPQCTGNTKSGSRCKRLVKEGEKFCGVHADQAPHVDQAAEEPAHDADCCESLLDRDPVDALVAVAVGGVLLGAALVFRRIFRIL